MHARTHATALHRAEVYAAVRQVIANATDAQLTGVSPASPYWSLPMSFEHERIHIETSSVLLREMPLQEVCSL